MTHNHIPHPPATPAGGCAAYHHRTPTDAPLPRLGQLAAALAGLEAAAAAIRTARDDTMRVARNTGVSASAIAATVGVSDSYVSRLTNR